MNNAIACTRVSTAQQADQYGIKTQLEDIAKFAQAKSLTITDHIDEAQSGADNLESREAVQRYYALADAQKGLHFIFPRVNRLGRRAELMITIARELQGRGANVHVIGVPGDLATKEGWFVFTILCGQAEYEYRSDNETMQKGKARKAREGKWAHGSPPLGYRILRDQKGKADQLEVVPEEAALVRQIFDAAEQLGKYKISRVLPKRMSVTTIENCITNEIYTGIFWYGKGGNRPREQWIPIPVPAIITREQWERVQKTRAERVSRRPASIAKTPCLLTGYTRCAVCGAAMTSTNTSGHWKGHRYTNRYYICWKRNTRGLEFVCSHKTNHKKAALEEQCWSELLAILRDPDRLTQFFTPPQPQANPQLEAHILELEARVKRAWESYTHGAPLEVARALSEAAQAELEAAKRQRQPAQSKAPSVDMTRVQAALERVGESATFEQKRALFELFNVRFFIDPDGLKEVSLSFA